VLLVTFSALVKLLNISVVSYVSIGTGIWANNCTEPITRICIARRLLLLLLLLFIPAAQPHHCIPTAYALASELIHPFQAVTHPWQSTGPASWSINKEVACLAQDDGDREGDGRSRDMERSSGLHNVFPELRCRHGKPVALPVSLLPRRRR